MLFLQMLNNIVIWGDTFSYLKNSDIYSSPFHGFKKLNNIKGRDFKEIYLVELVKYHEILKSENLLLFMRKRCWLHLKI